MRTTLILLLLFGNSLPLFAAGGKHSLQDIRDTVRQMVADDAPAGDPWHIEVGQLDSRLNLRQCDRELETFMPGGEVRTGNLTVGVRCTGEKPWKLYVPVAVKVYTPVVVLRQPVSVGAVLSAADLGLEKRDVSRLTRGYYRDPAALVGKQLKRNIGSGRIVTKGAVANLATIRRGQKVVLKAATPAFDIRVEAEALSAGGVGDRIKVRNLSSRQVVEGVISSSGHVMVAL